MDLKGKRLLILGGSIQCLKVVQAAKEIGVYTIVTDIKANPQVGVVADELLPYSVTDVDAIYRWCQIHPVDGVLNYCIDYSQHAHQILCERLNLPCFGTYEQYHALTDKTVFKELCVRNNVDVIPEYTEENIESIEYPVLVKPAESSGSRGLEICYSKSELAGIIEKARAESRNQKIVIEKYMGGKQDFTVTFLIIEGKPYLIRIGDRHLGKVEDGLDRQCVCTTSPSTNTSLYFKYAHNNILHMLSSLGIKNGPVFLQGFVDGDKFRFYDPGIRFPGGEYDRLFQAATGINLVKSLVIYALTGVICADGLNDNSYQLNGKVAVQLTLAARAGVINEYSGFDEIERIPGVICIAQKAKVGTVVPNSGDVKQRVIEIDLIANGHSEVGIIANQIYKKLKILDQNGDDMLVSKFNGEYVY